MRPPARLIVLILFSLVAMELQAAQTQPSEQKATTPQEANGSDQEIGKSYETLRLEQKRLVDDFVSRYNQTTASKLVPEQAYDNARLSIRTESFHDKDNVHYHKGFPICYRLKNGPPSIQYSISRDKKMSDIDVDYRSSTFPKALVDGHLTAANSDVRAGNNLDSHDNRPHR